MRICEIDAYGVWTGAARPVEETDPCPPGWVLADPPGAVPAGAVAAWLDGGWQIGPPPARALAGRKAAMVARVMSLRDGAITGGFAFAGVRYQTRDADRENIAGAAQLAFMAIVAGAKSSDLRWSDPGADFCWIAEDNDLVPMDAPTMVAFGKAAAAFKQACIFKAYALKGALEAAADAAALDAIDLTAGWPG